MDISRINIYAVDGKVVKANGNIGFNDMMVVNFSILEGKNGLFIKFPSHSYEDKDGKTQYVDDFYIMDKEFRDEVTTAILDEYDKVVEVAEEEKKNTRSKASRRR